MSPARGPDRNIINRKEGQRRYRNPAENPMPQDVYIYRPGIPVPKNVRHIEIPEGTTVIEPDAFSGCFQVESVTIPAGVTKIGDNAFYDCSALQSVTIPDSVTAIRAGAFSGCSSLRSVTIPGGVTELGKGVFEACTGLRSVVIQDGAKGTVSPAAFCGCTGLREVTIPDGITKIGERAFAGCKKLRSVTIPNSVTEIGTKAFKKCSRLRTVTLPDSIAQIEDYAFKGCRKLQCVSYRDADIAKFIKINGYGVNTFRTIGALMDNMIPLSKYRVKQAIDAAHRNRLDKWIGEYQIFGEMRLSTAMKTVPEEEKQHLRRCFTEQRKTGHHVPRILDELATAVHACGISAERMAANFDIEYTRNLLGNRIPIVPAEVCRCYYDKNICNMLIQKDKISVMAEAIGLYNRSQHQACYKSLMDFIVSHTDTGLKDILYAVDHAKEIPMTADTTLAMVRQHRTYTENLEEVARIEADYGRYISGFKLSDYICNISPVAVTYNGLTARVLDLSEKKDIALAAGLGDLTDCCQCLGSAGETAMTHGFMNPDAGFWVIEDKNGEVKAQAEIWEADKNTLVFDNIEFAHTDDDGAEKRMAQLCGVIAAWAKESGYKNIVMGCGHNELGTDSMERAPRPKLILTPEEIFAMQEDNDAGVSFGSIADAEAYMQTERYDPDDFVYTDTDRKCVYIKHKGKVSDYLMQGYDIRLAGGRGSHERVTEKALSR